MLSMPTKLRCNQISLSSQNKLKLYVESMTAVWECVHVCVCPSLFGSLPLCFFLRAGRSLEGGHSNVSLQKCISSFLQIRFECTKEKPSPSLPSSLTPVSSLPPASCSVTKIKSLLLVFLSLLRRPRTPLSVGVITAECRLLWRRLPALTGFGMGTSRGNMRTSRLSVTRQRVKQCDRYYSVYPFSNDSLDVTIPFFCQVGDALFVLATHHREVGGQSDIWSCQGFTSCEKGLTWIPPVESRSFFLLLCLRNLWNCNWNSILLQFFSLGNEHLVYYCFNFSGCSTIASN